MSKVTLTLEGDPTTGAVAISGPLENPMLIHWLLGEARRHLEARFTEKAKLAAERRILIPELHLHPSNRSERG